MESSVPHPGRIIRTKGHVLRSNKFTHNVPNDDEHHLPERGRGGMAFGLYG